MELITQKTAIMFKAGKKMLMVKTKTQYAV